MLGGVGDSRQVGLAALSVASLALPNLGSGWAQPPDPCPGWGGGMPHPGCSSCPLGRGGDSEQASVR